MRKPLPILNSVIKESLRLQPSIPSGVQRVTPPDGLRIGERFIPGNTVCRIPEWVIFRDSRFFQEPNAFIPERWTTRKDLIVDDKVLKPFGFGKYHCVGFSQGMMQIRAALANFVARYDFTLSPDTDETTWENSGKDSFTMVFGALPLLIKSRNS